MTGSRDTGRGGFTLVELAAVVAILAVVAVLVASRVGRVAQRARVVAAEADLRTLREAFTDEATGLLHDLRGLTNVCRSHLRVVHLLAATNLYNETRRLDVDELQQTAWDADRERGWRGPYVKAPVGAFPSEGAGFFPDVRGLLLPDDYRNGRDGGSVYGFPGEPALLDPWGHPYVLQVPPPQAFTNNDARTVTDAARFAYARVVSAGPNGVLEADCFFVNHTNRQFTTWSDEEQRAARLASHRGDDLVLFLLRNDTDEEATE